jgi:hypothetical protein
MLIKISLEGYGHMSSEIRSFYEYLNLDRFIVRMAGLRFYRIIKQQKVKVLFFIL